jgi:CubicO group peptidase (beta-lactamase class C family)
MLPALAGLALAALIAAAPAQETREPADLSEILVKVHAGLDAPALGGAVVDVDGLAAIGVAGTRVQGRDEKVTNDDLWHLGSCTKAMTATLVARLHEKGDLPLDTTLAEALPGLREEMHESYRGVPISFLLQNRAGVPGGLPQRFPDLWTALWRMNGEAESGRRHLAADLLAREPDSDPGTSYQYSNAGFAIAGLAAETKTKAVWEELLRREVFAPLGMDSAGFGPPGDAKKRDQPFGHRATAGGATPVPPGPFADNPDAIGAAGIVHASLADWARFVRLHLRGARGEKGLLLEPETFSTLHTPPDGQDYAMGWLTGTRRWARGDKGDGRVLTHDGSNTMWRCSVWIAPERGFAVLAVCNVGGAPGRKACGAVIEALIATRKP